MNASHSTLLPQRIATTTDLAICLDHLRDLDPVMDRVMKGLGDIPLRLRPAGYEGMAEIIVGQMVSKASASAILVRLRDALGTLSGEQVLAAGDTVLLATGLSRAKKAALVNLAMAEKQGSLDFDSLCLMPVDDAMAQMVALKGIGPWTAQVFLMFCAGHVDVFAAGDIALQQAMADIGLIDERPAAKDAAILAERWQPVRAAAARVLWAEYAKRRRRDELPV